jgi:hypothetical protein
LVVERKTRDGAIRIGARNHIAAQIIGIARDIAAADETAVGRTIPADRDGADRLAQLVGASYAGNWVMTV